VVEVVKEFAAKLKIDSFRELELAMDREINLPWHRQPLAELVDIASDA
jgi:hypothetical protein